MDQLAAWNYDALMILTRAVRDAGVDWAAIKNDPDKIAEMRQKVRENILNRQGYKGVLGTFSFTPEGNGPHEVSVVEVHQDGKHTLKKVVQVKPQVEATPEASATPQAG